MLEIMASHLPRFPAVAAVTLTLVLGLLACGGSDPPAVVARVDGTPITRETLSRWMSVIVAGDSIEHVGRRAPNRLVADPPDYRACESAIESLGPAKDARGEHMRNELQCRRLYDGVKQQTLSFLIEGMWNARESSELGIEVSGREVGQRLAKTRAERYPTAAAFKAFLGSRGLTLSDERWMITMSLQAERLEAHRRHVLSRKLRGEALQRALLEAYAESRKKWSARTRCTAGYFVPQCRGRQPTAGTASSSPAIVLEQIAASRRSKRG
jgi:hypothetical protein